MFRELQSMSHVTASSLYETVNVIIERKIELDQLCLFQNEVDTAIQLVEKRLNDEQGEGVARFYLNKVLYAEYKEANATINPIPTISSLKLDDNPVTTSSGEKFKTPVRPKKTKPTSMASRMSAVKEESHVPLIKKTAQVKTPAKVERAFQLAKPSFGGGGGKKGKLAIFDDENKLPKPKLMAKREKRAKKVPKVTRARTRAQRKAILNEAGNNEPQEDDRAGDFGDDVFLSPIRAGGGGDETEARRKFTPNSRPTSPLLRSGVTMPDNGGQTPSGAEGQTPLPLVGGVQGTHTVDVRSSETLLELARQRAIWRWHARRNGPS